ncbi:MAG: apolipoprotein N-acyltransferase [candidate division KSB1 bacterium]|nr:apolipoprotein N-acyltransferase [candidate division KSB1 bacterium]
MNKKIVWSILSGILLALSFPPFKTGFLAYGALIPLFWLLQYSSLKQAAVWGYMTGLVFYAATVFWIAVITLPGCIGTLLVVPLYLALYSVLHTLIIKRLGSHGYLFLPFLWIAVEYLQSLSEFSFPWNHLGYTQTFYLPLIQHASLTSVYGVSFWIFLFNVLLFFLYQCRQTKTLRVRIGVVLVLWFVLPLVHGLLITRNSSHPLLKVAMIQGNIDPIKKWEGDIYENNFRRYGQLSRQALQQNNVDLLIWPETALPFYLRLNRTYRNRLENFVDSVRVPVLTGTLDYDYDSQGQSRHYKSAHLYAPDTSAQRYDKIKLVPFSERVPYPDSFPFQYVKPVMYQYGTGNYSVGDSIYVFEWKESRDTLANTDKRIKTGVAICYESVYPEHVRAYVKQGAQFITVITNDAWFGKSSGPYQHAQIAVMRAIENRRAVARCANTGISCFIDPYGRVRQSTDLFTTAVVTGNIELCESLTFFTRYGLLLPEF